MLKSKRAKCLSRLILAVGVVYVATSFWLTLQLDDSSKPATTAKTATKTTSMYQTPKKEKEKVDKKQKDPTATTLSKSSPGSTKPKFIVHVGPQKTMSSAMQCAMRQLAPTLAEDGYHFAGKTDFKACSVGPYQGEAVNKDLIGPFYRHECSDRFLGNNLNDIPCWRRFIDKLKNLQQNYTDTFRVPDRNTTTWNIIMSDEKISEAQIWWNQSTTFEAWKVLKENLPFEFHIVMVYRRYYQWLASIKNQGDKYSLGRPRMKAWDGGEKEPIFPHLLRWIHNASQIDAPDPVQTYHLFHDQLGLPVSLMNMHDGSDLLEQFFCHILETPKTCRQYRLNPQKYRSQSNPSENPFCDMIAYDAYKRGLIRDLRGHRKGADRIFYHEMICRRMTNVLHKNVYDFPLVCPTKKEVQILLDKTLEMERTFMTEFYESPLGREKLEEQFWKDVDAQKFCHVNTTAVLQDPAWLKYIHDLWHPSRGVMPEDWKTSNYKITKKNFTNTLAKK